MRFIGSGLRAFCLLFVGTKSKNEILKVLQKINQQEQANIDITLHAVKIINSNKNMYKTLFAGSDLFQNILDKINFDCLDIFEKIRV